MRLLLLLLLLGLLLHGVAASQLGCRCWELLWCLLCGVHRL
jgi:hypothetical protein